MKVIFVKQLLYNPVNTIVDIDSRYLDERGITPNLQDISVGVKDAVSPILVGRMYEITKYIDENTGEKYAVKVLRPSLANSDLYPRKNLEEIFEEHVQEHELFVRCFGDMVEPSDFFVETSPDGQVQYCAVQPWIEDGVQYKEAVKNGRKLSESQFPDLDQRIKFLEGLDRLFKEIGNKLPDLDIFISRGKHGTNIRIFDTTGLWFEKRGGKDRNSMVNGLQNFLFTKEELKDERVNELFNSLYVTPDYFD